MPPTIASKGSPIKAQQGLDGSPTRSSRSHKQGDRLSRIFPTLNPVAVTHGVKVLETNGKKRRSSKSPAQWGRLVAKYLCGPRVIQDMPTNTVGNAELCAASSTPTDDLERFNEQVLIVKGDIGSFAELDGHKIDGIAFPTAPNLRNSGSGSAAAVFTRAGDGLASYVEALPRINPAGTVRVTPGFGAGVDKLIHAVGPRASASLCFPILESTYRVVMGAAQRESLKCLALVSISTGNNGVPCEDAARAALRAIQRFLSRNTWPGVVGIVCSEQEVFDAFTQEKQAMLEASDFRSL